MNQDVIQSIAILDLSSTSSNSSVQYAVRKHKIKSKRKNKSTRPFISSHVKSSSSTNAMRYGVIVQVKIRINVMKLSQIPLYGLFGQIMQGFLVFSLIFDQMIFFIIKSVLFYSQSAASLYLDLKTVFTDLLIPLFFSPSVSLDFLPSIKLKRFVFFFGFSSNPIYGTILVIDFDILGLAYGPTYKVYKSGLTLAFKVELKIIQLSF